MCTSPAASDSQLVLQITPIVGLEPAFVTVSIRVSSDPDNRRLEVVADSQEFRRSSEIPLDGDRAPRVSTFEFRDLPSGKYDVSATLSGSRGSKATVTRSLLVVASRGRMPSR